VLGGIAFAVTIVGVGALTGYASGLDQRRSQQGAEQTTALKEQFDLGTADLLEGRYELARQRFAYIVAIEPDYPGAREFLGDALVALDQPTATVTPSPSPTIDITPSATPDLATYDGMLAGAQAASAQGDYDGAMDLLITLIAEAPDYRRGEVNQVLYNTLRNRGLEKIWRGDQEQGIYDLTLASRLAALDGQAQSWLNSAAFYLFANSYYGLDPALATQYLADVCAAGLWDACFKYARSAWEYADKLVKDEDPCAAIPYYQDSITTREDAALGPTATEAYAICLTATAPAVTATATLDLTTTATPTLGPTATPTATGPPPPTGSATATGPPPPTATMTATATATSTPTDTSPAPTP
jgi:tetratricopeptide (TPR) repeat protein